MFSGVQINHELRQRTFKFGQSAAQDDKPRTRQLGCGFKVHHAKLFADFEMFDWREVKRRRLAPTVDLDIIVLVVTYRHFRVKNVGKR